MPSQTDNNTAITPDMWEALSKEIGTKKNGGATSTVPQDTTSSDKTKEAMQLLKNAGVTYTNALAATGEYAPYSTNGDLMLNPLNTYQGYQPVDTKNPIRIDVESGKEIPKGASGQTGHTNVNATNETPAFDPYATVQKIPVLPNPPIIEQTAKTNNTKTGNKIGEKESTENKGKKNGINWLELLLGTIEAGGKGWLGDTSETYLARKGRLEREAEEADKKFGQEKEMLKYKSDLERQNALAILGAKQGMEGGGAGFTVPGFKPIEGHVPSEKDMIKVQDMTSEAAKQTNILDEARQMIEASNNWALMGTKEKAQMESLRNQLIGKLRVQLVGPGVMSESDRRLIEQAIPKFGKTVKQEFKDQSLAKLDLLKRNIIGDVTRSAQQYKFVPKEDSSWNLNQGEQQNQAQTQSQKLTVKRSDGKVFNIDASRLREYAQADPALTVITK